MRKSAVIAGEVVLEQGSADKQVLGIIIENKRRVKARTNRCGNRRYCERRLLKWHMDMHTADNASAKT